MRLDRFLVLASIGTRREAKSIINSSEVTVNGQVVSVPETEVDENIDVVCFNGERIRADKAVYYMFNKPGDCITARSDKNSKTVLDYFGEVDTTSIFPVGRLDKDTEGLIFLTNDGEFDQYLMNPMQHVDKTYFFWAMGELSEEWIRKITEGMYLHNDPKITKPARIEVLQEGLYTDYEDEIGSNRTISRMKINRAAQRAFSGLLTISEGRNHQVKRMLKEAGCLVVYLKRIAIGEVALDEKLGPGEYRQLSMEEFNSLFTKKS